jgi:predicted xylose isomerase-like sugar epimerase
MERQMAKDVEVLQDNERVIFDTFEHHLMAEHAKMDAIAGAVI